MSLTDIANGKKRALGNGGGDAPAQSGDSPLIRLDEGEKLIGTYDSKSTVASSYKKADGSPQPDVNYYRFTVTADTGLTRPIKSDTGKITGVEPIKVGDKVTLRGIGDLPDSMQEAEIGMLLEVESLGTRATKSGFNFALFLVSVFEDDEA